MKITVIHLAQLLEVTEDTVRKAIKNGASRKMAPKLEEITGIPRLRFLYPDEFGDPWPEVVRMQRQSKSDQESSEPPTV